MHVTDLFINKKTETKGWVPIPNGTGPELLSASFKLRLEVEHYCQQLLFVLLCWEFEALLNFI
jgi:hypothetical protein